MKLLMYGVSKETVTKEDAQIYKLTPKKKETQMNDILELDGIEEIVILDSSFRNEYYLYVDELVFSHGDFLRYLSDQTGKSLEEIILETYSKFNEDVLHHLYEIASGYFSDIKGCFKVLNSVEKALDFAENLKTTGEVLFKLFSETLELAYSLKLEMDLQPLNDSQISKYIYLLKKEMKTLENKNYVIAANDFELIVLTKILLVAGAQTITITNTDVDELERQFAMLKANLTESEGTRLCKASAKSLNYRIAKADAVILDAAEFNLLDAEIQEEISVIRQTKKIQYLLDTGSNSLDPIVVEGLNLRFIDSNVKFSYNDEEKEQAEIAFEEMLSSQIEKFMEYFEQFQNDNIAEPSY